MNLRQITIILFILFFFLTIFISHAGAKKSIRLELTTWFIKTEYFNGEPEKNPSIYPTTRVLGDFGYKGSFDASTGKYLVKEEWLDTQFNIKNLLDANAALHLTIPKLTDAKYHFVQEDLDVGSFYFLDRKLDLLKINNIEFRLISAVGVTPLEFKLPGPDVCNHVRFTDFKRGNETHYAETEIYGCDGDSLLTIILEVEDEFWDGKPRIEVPSFFVIPSSDQKQKMMRIWNNGSGDLDIYNFKLGGDAPDYFRVSDDNNCMSKFISPDHDC